ncbi:helix-turn-helix domain-containing protein [Pseudescherichia sp.]|uniref:helix-turn-helix domain-containing protein n=1 Tax=Pseudescherichia sp. TaxID=2055881 RepID=UPI00289C2933|nr:helix-turn-helix domain-containing protein [Pseudescherichia sp.]
MKRISYLQQIISYIGEHPGRHSTDIIAGTGLIKSTVNGTLSKLVIAQRVRREGFEKQYRYIAVDKTAPHGRTKPEPKAEGVNLNAMFNSLLMAARENRA